MNTISTKELFYLARDLLEPGEVLLLDEAAGRAVATWEADAQCALGGRLVVRRLSDDEFKAIVDTSRHQGLVISVRVLARQD